MFTKPVSNFTRTPDRRIDLTVGISYSEDLRKVESVVRNAVADLPGRLADRETEFFYKEFADSSIEFEVRNQGRPAALGGAYSRPIVNLAVGQPKLRL